MQDIIAARFTEALRRSSSERGASGVEYGILIATIAAVIVGVSLLLGRQIVAAFQTVLDALPG